MSQLPEKSLDRKLARLRAEPNCGEFILADAKDGDMAYGLAAPGQSPEYHGSETRFRSLAEYRELIRGNVRQGLVDIMLMSASTSEVLTIHERLFDQSHITPGIRANDTTDVHLAKGGRYRDWPARPFRSATIDQAQCGRADCGEGERGIGANLGLFSVTFNNDLDSDLPMLEAYKAFRLEAERKGFRHFLEVFDPNACGEHCPEDLGRFISDHVVRILAGVPEAGRPVFLKMPYHGPRQMEMIAHYDHSLIPGILGGSAGTTYDAFKQLRDARKHGARAALYGRMINNSEHQPTFIKHLRWLADGELDDPAEAVRSYHGALQSLGVAPHRSLDQDLQATLRQTGYGEGPGSTITVPASSNGQSSSAGDSAASNDAVDFTRMTAQEKVAWNLARWDRIFER